MGVTFSGGFNGIIKKIGNAIKLTIKAHFIFLCERRFEYFLNRKYSCSLVIRSKLGQRPSGQSRDTTPSFWCRLTVGDSLPVFLVKSRQGATRSAWGTSHSYSYSLFLLSLSSHLSNLSLSPSTLPPQSR